MIDNELITNSSDKDKKCFIKNQNNFSTNGVI